MAKYHITAKGEPGVCRATKSCPLGGEGDHYSTPQEAAKAFEDSQSGSVAPVLKKETGEPSLPKLTVQNIDDRFYNVKWGSSALDRKPSIPGYSSLSRKVYTTLRGGRTTTVGGRRKAQTKVQELLTEHHSNTPATGEEKAYHRAQLDYAMQNLQGYGFSAPRSEEERETDAKFVDGIREEGYIYEQQRRYNEVVARDFRNMTDDELKPLAAVDGSKMPTDEDLATVDNYVYRDERSEAKVANYKADRDRLHSLEAASAYRATVPAEVAAVMPSQETVAELRKNVEAQGQDLLRLSNSGTRNLPAMAQAVLEARAHNRKLIQDLYCDK